MRLNIHKKEPNLMSMLLLETIDGTGVFKLHISKQNFQINHGFYTANRLFCENTIKMVHQSIIIIKCTRLCPFNEHLKFCYGNICYEGIAA